MLAAIRFILQPYLTPIWFALAIIWVVGPPTHETYEGPISIQERLESSKGTGHSTWMAIIDDNRYDIPFWYRVDDPFDGGARPDYAKVTILKGVVSGPFQRSSFGAEIVCFGDCIASLPYSKIDLAINNLKGSFMILLGCVFAYLLVMTAQWRLAARKDHVSKWVGKTIKRVADGANRPFASINKTYWNDYNGFAFLYGIIIYMVSAIFDV